MDVREKLVEILKQAPYSEKKSIFQIYANGSKNREKRLGKSDN